MMSDYTTAGESSAPPSAARWTETITTTRRAGVFLLAVACLAFSPPLAPMLMHEAMAQDEAGKGVQFPFRAADGRIMWIAKAQNGERLAALRHPTRPGTIVDGYRFSRDRIPGVGQPRYVGPGVEIVIAVTGDLNHPASVEQVARLTADVCTFFRADELLHFENVRLDVSAPRSERSGQPATSSTLPPAVLTTESLFLQWEPGSGDKKKHIHLFSDAHINLDIPTHDLVIQRARGFRVHEGDPEGRVRLLSHVEGRMTGAAMLDLGTAARSDWRTRPETRFRAEGECVFFLGDGFRESAQRITMERAVEIVQFPDRRMLRGSKLDATFADRDGVRVLTHLLAEGRAELRIPGNLRTRTERLRFSHEDAPTEGATKQIVELTGVERVSLFSDERSVGPLAPTPTVEQTESAIPPPVGTRSIVRIDAYADQHIRLERLLDPGRTDGRLGSETWTMLGFARLERWVGHARTDRRLPGSGRPDFDVEISPDRLRGAIADPRPAAGPAPPAAALDPDEATFRLTAILNGSGRDRYAREGTAMAGSIRASFTLREASAISGDESTRELLGLSVDNPGILPILDVKSGDPGAFLRVFANRLTVTERPTASGRVEQIAHFAGTNPQISWLSPRNLFSLFEVPLPVETRFLYVVDGDGEFTIAQEHDRLTGRVWQRTFRFPGIVRLRKSPFNLREFDRRLVMEADCRDLQLGFDSRFGAELECNFITAKAPIPGTELHARPLELVAGLDRLTCQGIRYERIPDGPTAEPQPALLGRFEPAIWAELLTIDGPAQIDIRDGNNLRRFPFSNAAGQPVFARMAEGTVQEKFTLRQRLERIPEQSIVTFRRISVVGPFAGRAVALDPRGLPAEAVVPTIAEIRGQTLIAELERDTLADSESEAAGKTADVPADEAADPMAFTRMVRAALSGDVVVNYLSRGIRLSGQLIDYRHDPRRLPTAQPRLILVGNPTFSIAAQAAATPGTLRITFPTTDNPMIAASRRIEVIGEPSSIRIRPRSGLSWRSQTGERLDIDADEMDIEMAPLGDDGRPITAGMSPAEAAEYRAQREWLGPFSSGVSARYGLRELLGRGNVAITDGDRTADGETFLWRQLPGTPDRYAYLWGPDSRVAQTVPGRMGFDLRRATPLGTRPFGQRWLPGPDDPADPAPLGTTYRFRSRDPQHPERKDIITGTATDRMRLRLTIPNR